MSQDNDPSKVSLSPQPGETAQSSEPSPETTPRTSVVVEHDAVCLVRPERGNAEHRYHEFSVSMSPNRHHVHSIQRAPLSSYTVDVELNVRPRDALWAFSGESVEAEVRIRSDTETSVTSFHCTPELEYTDISEEDEAFCCIYLTSEYCRRTVVRN